MGYDSPYKTGKSTAWDLMYTGSMSVKKILKDSFEQVIETGRDMAKSSVKQVASTLSPWDMIRNSFNEDENSRNPLNQHPDQQSKGKEINGKGGNNTPLNFEGLNKSYADQDKQKIESMKQRLFQMVKRDDERSVQRVQQKKAEKERAISQEEADAKRRENDKQRQSSLAAPQGKSKGRKRKAAEPQPAETKPGSSKQ